VNQLSSLQSQKKVLRGLHKAFPALASQRQELVVTCLSPVLALASWLQSHAPDLARQSALHLVVAAAEAADARDAGRWYALLPFLVGNPSMDLTVTVLAERIQEIAEPDRTARGSIPQQFEELTRSSVAAGVRKLRPATLRLESLTSYFRAGRADLIALMRPDLRWGYQRWLDSGDLATVLGMQIPVAAFAYTEAEYLFDLATLRAMGMAATPRGSQLFEVSNDRIGAGCWGWLMPSAVGAGQALEPSATELARLRDLEQATLTECGPEFMDTALARLGKHFQAAGSGQGTPERDLAAITHDLAADLVSGEVFQIDIHGALVTGDPIAVIMPSVVRSYPAGDEHRIEQMDWAQSAWMEHLQPELNDAFRLATERFWSGLAASPREQERRPDERHRAYLKRLEKHIESLLQAPTIHARKRRVQPRKGLQLSSTP